MPHGLGENIGLDFIAIDRKGALMPVLATATAFVLFIIACLHLLWGLGVYWPFMTESDLARAVVGAKDITRMPSFGACVFVTLALTVGIVIVLRLGGVIAPKSIPLILFQIGGAGFAFVLLSRGLVGFLPFWAEITPEQPFRRLDIRFYSPLCILLGLAVVYLLFRSKSL